MPALHSTLFSSAASTRNSDRAKSRNIKSANATLTCLKSAAALPYPDGALLIAKATRSRGDPDRRVRHGPIARACPLPRGGALGLCAVIPQAGDARIPARRPDAQSHGHGANHGHGASWWLPPERTPAAQLRGVRGGQHRRRGIGDRADWCPRCPRVGEEAHTLRVRHTIAAMALQRVKMP